MRALFGICRAAKRRKCGRIELGRRERAGAGEAASGGGGVPGGAIAADGVKQEINRENGSIFCS